MMIMQVTKAALISVRNAPETFGSQAPHGLVRGAYSAPHQNPSSI